MNWRRTPARRSRPHSAGGKSRGDVGSANPERGLLAPCAFAPYLRKVALISTARQLLPLERHRTWPWSSAGVTPRNLASCRPRKSDVSVRPPRVPHGSARVLLGLVLSSTPGAAQHPYLQISGGVASGARVVSQSTGGDIFLNGGLSLGLALDRVMVRVDGRAFDTEAEPLLTVGVAIGVPLVRSQSGQLYVLGGAGLGAFVEEGDPGDHVGLGAGVTTAGPVGLFAEVRYDHLIGTFTYQSRHRGLASAVVGLRLGAP